MALGKSERTIIFLLTFIMLIFITLLFMPTDNDVYRQSSYLVSTKSTIISDTFIGSITNLFSESGEQLNVTGNYTSKGNGQTITDADGNVWENYGAKDFLVKFLSDYNTSKAAFSQVGGLLFNGDYNQPSPLSRKWANGQDTEHPESEVNSLLVQVAVPARNEKGETYTKHLTVNKHLAYDVVEIFNEIYDTTDFIIRDADTGGFNYRSTFSGTTTSTHSFGATFDVNWNINSMSYSPNYTGDKRLDLDSDDHPVVKIFREHGWGWGGDYTGQAPDPMHFSALLGW